MHDGICSKCGKREVRISPPALSKRPAGSLPVSTFRAVHPRYYCCTACGAVESFVEDADERALIAEKWERPG